ncbi:TPA: CvpA family protein [Streptococcus equi subsp. zooepidemicus]|uniref:CvpA family protein n=1 Tax=Streptococcus equi TaxID=1336 RepID=UPI001E398077|nr:CvpA family protein [Streptococcus equi]MCD3373210.1 CvpA family protein [Streptococcus equi subsp. zooepidemicus]MDI5952167.1 CvpA family protein [Streptococcus equi subsp. zooepidemicus]MDI6073838.1 CvpA family protein [Streptococcus equi subsp. zooepidemicus]HEK9955675.1 CvpA family protein [Streptococcus equi subsp. zooepidemicus]HEK9994398.1 CvpA family protein [Streptococcus equi subsp. zooepidemicus]
MLSVLILLLLSWSFYIGYNRGLILQTFYCFGALVSLLFAHHGYKALAGKLALWVPYSNPAEGAATLFFKDINIFELDKVYYAGIAFFILSTVGYAVVRLVGVLVHLAPVDYFDGFEAKLASGLLAVMVSVLFLSMALTVLATIPMPFIQGRLHGSLLSRLLVEHCPFISSILRQLWVTAIL